MRTENTFAIDFIIRLNKTQKDKALLYARVTVNGDRKEISLKHSFNAKDWDGRQEIVKGKSQEARTINNYIEDVRFRLKEKYRLLLDKQSTITAQAIKDAYLGKHALQKTGHTVMELLKYHARIAGDKLEPGTLKNYGATEQYLKAYIKFKYNKEDIFLTQLDYEFITELEHHIRYHPIKAHDPCKGNGVMKHLERFKKMVNWAKQLGWISSNPIGDYKLSFKRYKRKKLDITELSRIEEKQFSNPSLAYVKDLFLFSCYTGLAYCDVMALKPTNFESDAYGNLWCKIYRQKSEELSPVPVLKFAAELLLKYKDHPKAIRKGAIFPYISNQELNRNLKIIGETCDITKYMSFHLARHTFATAVTLKNGVPIETVSKMLGHTKITTTQIYADVDEEKIVEDMAGVEDRLKNRKENKK